MPAARRPRPPRAPRAPPAPTSTCTGSRRRLRRRRHPPRRHHRDRGRPGGAGPADRRRVPPRPVARPGGPLDRRPRPGAGGVGLHGLEALGRAGRAPRRDRRAGRRPPRPRPHRGHRPLRPGPGHRRRPGDGRCRPGARRRPSRRPVPVAAARPGVDQRRGDPPVPPLRGRHLRHRPGDHEAPRHHRAVVPAGGQPRRLRADLRTRQPAVAQEHRRQQRRREDRRQRRRRSEPEPPRPLGRHPRRLLRRPRRPELPGAGAGLGAGDQSPHGPRHPAAVPVHPELPLLRAHGAVSDRVAGADADGRPDHLRRPGRDAAQPRHPRIQAGAVGRPLPHQRRDVELGPRPDRIAGLHDRARRGPARERIPLP